MRQAVAYVGHENAQSITDSVDRSTTDMRSSYSGAADWADDTEAPMSCNILRIFHARWLPVASSITLVCAVLLAGMDPAGAATYYITTSGNDAGPGTQAQPWRTLQRAVSIVNPGDTVLVATGTYREDITF